MRKSLLASLTCLVGALVVVAALRTEERPTRAEEGEAQKADAATELPVEKVAVAGPERWVPVTDPATVEREGIAFHFELRRERRAELRAKELDVNLRLKLTDARSGEPVRGLHPLVWMWRREGDAPDEKACREKVKTFLSGMLSARADVDFNAYLALTLNNDNTISMINPQIAFSRTKLEALIPMPGAAADWVVSGERNEVYATLPELGRLALVDTARGRSRGTVAVGARPNRVLVAPDGAVWVGNDGDGSISIVDPASRKERRRISTAPGLQSIAFDPRRKVAWVAGSRGERLTQVDLETLERSDGPKVGTGVVALAWAPHADAMLALRKDAGELVLIDAARGEPAGTVKTGGRPHAMAMEPAGRWAFLLEQAEGRVVVVDTATQRIRQYVTGLRQPDALAFTRGFAYVRQAAEARVVLLPLAGLGRDEPIAPTWVSVAQRAPSEAFSPGLVSAIAPLPEGNGALIAAPADKALYVYTEGMMAASGSHQNYGREPRAVLILDRSLRESEPGLYVSHNDVPEPGLYDAAILLDSPRVAVCVSQRIGSDGKKVKEPPLVVETRFQPEPYLAGEPAVLRFKVRDPKRPEPLRAEELTVLLQRPPTGFQAAPRPALLPDGSFEVTFVPDDPGLYKLLLAAKKRGVKVGDVYPLDVKVKANPARKEEE